MKSPLLTSIAALLIAVPAFGADEKPAAESAAKKPLGHQDSPIIPGTKWHVHDGERPQPPIVTPGEPSTPEKVGTAPSDATVLFDGKDLSKWKMEKDGSDAKWKVEDGYMEVVPKSGYMETKEEFGPDFQLHVEFREPTPPTGDGQGRGNSGVFLFGRYEIQVLDSYNNPTYPDGQATGIYGYMPPQVNASRPPGVWQTYDILCEGPRFKDGKLEKAMIVTVLHNGVVTQNHTALIGETPHLHVGTYHPHPEKGPIKLQDHGNPIRYRNIWIRAMHMPTPGDIGDGPKIGQ
ncbi:protein of unknown function DUF1080 [Chthoniobacter flavus Ellin428]|uniref:3-keto-alpha-glucoside-1,2-lyase/3-keto-2-hydroxy-glucal hydratase domain-containing protein n=1 Tax=Chthoniobacter flavus Ellin428 TaxID=497964 RepID=B4CWY0_9BACT|nr:DUF1080 domain-containing protein [Chthoniobacter flavus]EDY21300.1 protein of unknown function DUF1080 [Chthoniobacter flavus Ellin428]TCO84931.1 uncharacterized protein DUF1080 [Chthoniobacter flavus]